MLIIHRIRMMKTVDILAHHARMSHAWPNNGTGCHQGLVIRATQLAQQTAHPWTLNVETAAGLGLKQLPFH